MQLGKKLDKRRNGFAVVEKNKIIFYEVSFFCRKLFFLLYAGKVRSKKVPGRMTAEPCTSFDSTDFCHLRHGSNLLICLLAIFRMNDNVVLLQFSFVQLRIMIR